ncbi:MAG: CPBP family intramembrane metalloprotease [Labilithrix sp.]|nr:CPBP family intramembrane metalloprotease [Labilithrix sp.]MCW5816880.1 CPBP family intramembrane metalloprotease [Labilithrix sp.]
MDEEEAPQHRPLTFFSAAIWTLIAMLLEAVCASATDSARPGAMVDPVSRMACLAVAYSVVLFGVLRLHEPQTSIRHVLALRRPSVLVCLLALALGAALALPSEWLDKALAARWPTSPDDNDHVDRLFSVATVGKRVALFVTYVIVHPVLKEGFFRGVLFTPLRRTRSLESVVLAVAAFETLPMFSPRSMLVLLGSTLVFSWLRGLSGSIVPSILAHVAFNAVGLVPLVLGKPELEPTRTLLLASAAAGVVALAGLTFLARGVAAVQAREADVAVE